VDSESTWKVEEKREKLSPRKRRKYGEREIEKYCRKHVFSREDFSPEKTLFRVFSRGISGVCIKVELTFSSA
jgi:hypothetical protein